MAKDCEAVKLTGPTPYSKSQSAPPASKKAHAGTAGRGGQGMHAEQNHPETHAAFENLGRK